MALSPEYIRSLAGDPECIAALAWLAEQAERYPSGGFTPPLKRRLHDTEPRPFLAVTARLTARHRGSLTARIGRLDWCVEGECFSAEGDDAAIASSFATRVLNRRFTGYMLVTSGKDRHVLDVWLESHGRELLRLGYNLQPCLTGGAVSFVTIRKGRYRWDLVYFETCTGRPVSDGISLAQNAGWQVFARQPRCQQLWVAVGAYAAWLLSTFGVAMQLTAGMAAVCAVRGTLPPGFQKWRPNPLLVAMCREGFGYRGGMTYASVHRGPTWRVDVTRQYTAALATQLPLRSSFGYIPFRGIAHPWLAVCRVRLGSTLQYPLGIWDGPNNGFNLRTVGRGEYVSIVSSAELPGIVASGGDVWPQYGYIHTATFSLSRHVELLQLVLSAHGSDSAEGRFSKPLGNYVYGKTGQRAKRTELMFSEANPGKSWWPYWDDEGVAWPNIWERTVVKHTASQHVDVAATITATARSQTASTWASLSDAGFKVVRCHTDSLTLDMDPSDAITISENVIGGWHVDSQSEDSVIVGPNAYFQDGEAHIAGVSEPTYEMIERLADGRSVTLTQTMKTPRRGFERGERVTERKYRATGR